ncbi:hypothetical protein HN51_059861 [Arachis hypogaea]|nr:uncharacterized protein DS421_20g704090 [Arachis hypogaea]
MKISFYISFLLLAISIGFGSPIITEARDCLIPQFATSCANNGMQCEAECKSLYGTLARAYCETQKCYCRIKC